MSEELARALAPAKTPAARATAPTPRSGFKANAEATPATIDEALRALYATIRLLMRAMVAVTPAEIFEATKTAAITPPTTSSSSLNSTIVLIRPLTLSPHSYIFFCDSVRLDFNPSFPVKPPINPSIAGIRVSSTKVASFSATGNRAAPIASFDSSIAIDIDLNRASAVLA